MNRKAYEKLDYSLALLSAAVEGKRHGCIINSFHQVTSSFPPKFTVTLNKENETYKAVEAAGSFSVTLLAEDAPAELIDLFGYRSGRVQDKFEGLDVKKDKAGNPWLKEHMVSRISCNVVDRLEIGNFVLLVGQCVLIAAVLMALITGGAAATYTPDLFIAPVRGVHSLGFLAYCLYLLIPTILHIKETIQWHISRSKICAFPTPQPRGMNR